MPRKQLVVKRKKSAPQRKEKDLGAKTGFEVAEEKKAPPAPVLTSSRKILITKSIKMTPELSKKIKLFAAINEIFESDLVANAVEQYLESKNFMPPSN